MRMWLDQLEAPDVFINPDTGEIALKDRRGVVRIDQNGRPYMSIELDKMNKNFVDSNWTKRTGAMVRDGQISTPRGGTFWSNKLQRTLVELSPTDIAWFQSADEFIKEAQRISGPQGPRKPEDLVRAFANLSKKIKFKLRKAWRRIWKQFKIEWEASYIRMSDVGKERRKTIKRVDDLSRKTQDIPHNIHTREHVENVIKELNEELDDLGWDNNTKKITTSPEDAAKMAGRPDGDDWGEDIFAKEKKKKKNAKKTAKERKKAKRLYRAKNARARAIAVYRDLLQVRIDIDNQRIKDLDILDNPEKNPKRFKQITLESKDLPKIESAFPGRTVSFWRRLKQKMNPGRAAAKVTFFGTAAALYMYYDLMKELLEKGASREQIAKGMGLWSAAHMESMDSNIFGEKLDELQDEVEKRYKLAWYRYGKIPPELAKIAKEKGIPIARNPSKEDLKIINAKNNVTKGGVLRQLLNTLFSGMGKGAFDDPYKPSKKQLKPGADPIHPKDPGYFSPSRGTGKFEESIDRNCKRSNKIKIKINS